MRFTLLALTLCVFALTSEPVISETTDVALKRVAVRSAAIVQLRNNKARKALINMSRDEVFETYLASDEVEDRKRHATALRARSRAMANRLEAQALTLLDVDGNGIFHVIAGEVLEAADTGQLKMPLAWRISRKNRDRLVTSPIYLSAQLDRWVFSLERPITSDKGNQAVLHAEFDLKSIQEAVSRRRRPAGIELLAITQEGWVVFDSREHTATVRRIGADHAADYFKYFEIFGWSVQELFKRQAAGELNHADADGKNEILVSLADNLYIVAIRTPVLPGAAIK